MKDNCNICQAKSKLRRIRKSGTRLDACLICRLRFYQLQTHRRKFPLKGWDVDEKFVDNLRAVTNVDWLLWSN